MKKTFVILSLLCIAFASCKKKSSTPQATYELDGVQDISMQNMVDSSKYLAIAVNHISGQTQETVTLTISGLPTGINMVTTTGSLTGIPTFSTILTFYDTTLFGATPGIYPITITSIGSQSGTKTFTFNLTITAAPSYSSALLGVYTNCFSSYSGINYSDTVSADLTVANKIWFSNFSGTGKKVYAIATSISGTTIIQLPTQTVSGTTFEHSNTPSQPFAGYYVPANGSVSDELAFPNTWISQGSTGNQYTSVMQR